MIQKVFDRILDSIPIIAIALAFLSGIALLSTSLQALYLPIEWSARGFQNYLALFRPYSGIFSATFILIAAHEAFRRLRLMEEANRNSHRASNRTLWIQSVSKFYDEVKVKDPEMVNHLTKDILKIHDYFFDRNYQFANQEDLKKMFDRFFREYVGVWESLNLNFQSTACYPNLEKSYSWPNFKLLVSSMIWEEGYAKFWSDLNGMYQESVVEFIKTGNHPIDLEAYKRGMLGIRII